MTYLRKPVQKATLGSGIEPPHVGAADSIQKLLEQLLRSLKSSGVLHDKGQKGDQPASNPDGRKYPDVEHWLFVGGWKLKALNNGRYVEVRECVMMNGWVQVMGYGHGGLHGRFMLRSGEGREDTNIKFGPSGVSSAPILQGR